MSIEAKLYAQDVFTKTCFPKNKVRASGGMLYDVRVGRFQGAIRYVGTPHGPVERKGTVEYINAMNYLGTSTPVVGYPQDVSGLVNAPQMWIRFASEEPKY